MSGENVVQFTKGKAVLKLWAAPKLAPDGHEIEARRLVDVEIDGWCLGPLHVADYDVMETLQGMAKLGTAPPGWGVVSLYGQSLGIRHRAGGTREAVVEAGRRAAMVMWVYVLRDVVERVGEDEAAVVSALREQAPGQDRSLGELMVELAEAIEGEAAAAEASTAAWVAVRAADEAAREASRRVGQLIGAAARAPRTSAPTTSALADAGVPDVG